MIKAVVFFAVLLAAPLTFADVVDSSPGGFGTTVTVTVNAPSGRAYAALAKIGLWWNKDHTWSGDSANLSLEARAGGCFCERLPGGGSVQHMAVIFAAPGKMLRLSGGLGPLQDLAISGVMTFAFAEANGATTITVTYKVGGYMPGGLTALAKPVDAVVTEQVMRMKSYIETSR